MSLGADPLDALEIPDGTTVGEHDLVTDGDVVVGGQSAVEFGVRRRNVLAGGRVTFGGDIEAEADCRLDMLGDVAGSVLIGNDTYLGERVRIAGRLMISDDLDIGDDIDVEGGFEANGWIIIRSPIPALVFYFIVLSQLLRPDEDGAADELAETLVDESSRDPLVIPWNATVSDDAWRVPTPAYIDSDCRIHGNIRAKSIDLAEDNNIFESLRTRDDIIVEGGTRIHGDVTIRNGEVRIRKDTRILDGVSCNDLVSEAGTHVDNTMRVHGEIHIHRGNLPREAE